MALRNLSSGVNTLLNEGTGFTYAHLLQFERPILSTSSSSEQTSSYAYITDASIDITWNGKVYFANKLKRIGSFTESTEASASASSVTISSLALGTSALDTLTFNSGTNTVTGTKDFIELGFAEGDTILLTASSSGNNDGKKFVITGFKTNNTVMVLGTIYDAITTESNVGYSLNLVSYELLGPVIDRTAVDYSTYLNREVLIYKVFFDEETGAMVGSPFLMFKGLISAAKLKEDPLKSSEITWSLTSHWGDFIRVQGRSTSDSAHRALNSSNESDLNSLIDKRYANDLGFIHSDRSINLTAVYQSKITEPVLVTKKKLFGLKKSYSIRNVEKVVDRSVDLRFNTDARYLPIVYGVQKVPSIPIFIDSKVDDPSEIYTAFAICEGEIGGIYDIHFDGQSTICKDDIETSSRGAAASNVEIVCTGRADRGDTLSSTALSGSNALLGATNDFIQHAIDGTIDFYNVNWKVISQRYDVEDWTAWDGQNITGVNYNGNNNYDTNILNGQLGIVDNQNARFNPGIPIEVIFHSGKREQKADQMLSKVAANRNFKIQQSYSPTNSDYWGANHRLLDTAYVAAKYSIGEGETEIQPMEFVVKGKYVQCYNYDYNYSFNKLKNNITDWDSFSVGGVYNLYSGETGGSGTSLGTVRIADKYTVYDYSGEIDYRIRFHEAPPISSNTTFYLDNGSSKYFYLETYNRVIDSGGAGSIQPEIKIETQVTVTTPGFKEICSTNDYSTLTEEEQTMLDAGFLAQLEMCGNDQYCLEQVYNTGDTYQSNNKICVTVRDDKDSIQTNTTLYVTDRTKLLIDSISGTNLANLAINGNYKIEVTYDDGEGTYYLDERVILEHGSIANSSYDYVKLDSPLSIVPTSANINNFSYVIKSRGDLRVSLNPAAQLLDYLTNKRYGKGLVASDLDLASFAFVARECDTNSDITVITTSAATVGDYYTYTSGPTYFRGKVLSSTSRTVNSTTYYETVFTDVIGKLGTRYRVWKASAGGYSQNELVWTPDGNLYKWGTGNSLPSTAAGTISLTQESGTGPASLNLETNTTNDSDYELYNFDGNCLVKSFTEDGKFGGSGYSLYDADDVIYWRYMGWDHPHQRYATRHQLNTVIDTSVPLFDNINAMLSQFNGILRYENGKYVLDLKTKAPTLEADRTIEEQDIIGEILLEDSGIKSSFNGITLNFSDPANKFASRSVELTDSTYLKRDKGIPKKGSVNVSDITNYYTARMQATQYLKESRNSLGISFTMVPRGLKLLAGTIIKLNYSRFGWVNKYFRIENLTFEEDCLVKVDASEHNDDAYLITKEVSLTASTYKGSSQQPDRTLSTPGAPTSLSYTITNNGETVILSWTNNADFVDGTWQTEIYRSSTNNRDTARVIANVPGTSFNDTAQAGPVYYWIRHYVDYKATTGTKSKRLYSEFNTGVNVGLLVTILSSIPRIHGVPRGGVLSDTTEIFLYETANIKRVKFSEQTYIFTPAGDQTEQIIGVAGNVQTYQQNVQDIPQISLTTWQDYDTVEEKLDASYLILMDQSDTTDPIKLVKWYEDSSLTPNISYFYNAGTGNASPSTYWNSIAGTVSADANSNRVTGTSTSFNSHYAVGDYIKIGSIAREVLSVESNTVMYVDTPFVSAISSATAEAPTLRIDKNKDALIAAVQNIAGVGFKFFLDPSIGTVPKENKAKIVKITGGDAFIFSNGSSTPAPTQIELEATLQNIDPANYNWQYYDSSTSSWTDFSPAETSQTFTITYNNSVWGSDTSLRIRCVSEYDNQGTTEYYDDDITIKKINDGEDGLKTVEGYVYYNTATATAPSGPGTSATYTWANGSITGMNSGWQQSPPQMTAGANGKYYYSRYTVTQSIPTDTTNTPTFGAVTLGHNFSGLVTFSGSSITDGTSSITPVQIGGAAYDINTNITTINGGQITTGSVTALQIQSDTITANKLTNSSTNTDYNNGNNIFSIGNTGNVIDGYCATSYFYSNTTNCAAVAAEIANDGNVAILGASRGNNTNSYGGLFVWTAQSNYTGGSKNKVLLAGANYLILAQDGTTTKFSVTEGGTVVAAGNVTAYSDIRLKDDIELIEGAVTKCMTLQGVTFRMKGHSERSTGLIAQEVRRVLPEAVTETEDGVLTLAYGNMAGLFVEAIKELQDQISELKREVKRLKDDSSN